MPDHRPTAVTPVPDWGDRDILTADPPTEIGNEFASVLVRRVYTRNGVRLQIISPRLGFEIRLDPLELESLTWQTPETFARLLEHPYGPPGAPQATGHVGNGLEDTHGPS